MKTNCSNCSHSRTKHKHHHKMICEECKCHDFKCSFCGLVNATGRSNQECYRSNVCIDAVDIIKVKFAIANKYREPLMYWYYQQMECGCWIALDVRKAFQVNQKEWFEFAMHSNAIQRLERVAELWNKSMNETRLQIASVLNQSA